MRQIAFILATVLSIGCGTVPEINRISRLNLSDPSFYATMAGQLDAPMVTGNRVEILLNGDEIFPAMLKAIETARKSITYAQFLYKGGIIAHQFAQALAERCRAGVAVKI